MPAPPKITGRSTKQRKADREKEAASFRDRVWARDGARDRVNGCPLLRHAHVSLRDGGQVCHLKGRRVRPEWKIDPDHALLMSDLHHRLSDHRGGRLLRLTDPDTGESATVAGNGPFKVAIRFTLYNRDGSVKWTTIG